MASVALSSGARLSAASPSSPTWASTEDINPTPLGSISRSSSFQIRHRHQGSRHGSLAESYPSSSQLSAPHPLAVDEKGGVPPPDDVLGDVSRPNLRRYTNEVERQVAESSRSGGSDGGSLRGSLDLLRMSVSDQSSEEVEVLIHRVQPAESLAGIALLYGIDLAILRKSNKLWSSDPVHLRTRLYVPLEACRWNKASNTLLRGPGEGQVTLIAKHVPSRKGKEVDRGVSTRGSFVLDQTDHLNLNSPDISTNRANDYQAWSREEGSALVFAPDTNLSYGRPSADTVRPDLFADDDDQATPRVLDIVRIPNSQLRFFPKARKPPNPTPRSSLEQDLRDPPQPELLHDHNPSTKGPSIQNDLHTLPKPLQPLLPPHPPRPKSSTIVRLRPPSNLVSPPGPNTLAGRLSSLFIVPPPPVNNPYAFVPSPKRSNTRRSMETVLSSPSGHMSSPSSPARTITPQPEVFLELRPRSSFQTLRLNGGAGQPRRGRSKKQD